MYGPDFMLIGASKSATSSIVDWLRLHPNIFITQPKEPNCFNRDCNYAQGLDWYRRLFAGAESHQIRGEGSNLYTALSLYPNTIDRIAVACPQARFVYAVRDPISRIRSLWIQLRPQAGGDEVDSNINRAIHKQWALLIDTSLYDKQLSAFEGRFGVGSVRTVLYEDFCRDPVAVMGRICQHIGVSAAGLPVMPMHLNPSAGKTLVSPWLGRLRRIPGSALVRRVVPLGVKRWGRNVLPRVGSNGSNAQLSEESIAQIKTWVGDDSRRLLDRLGRSYSEWPTAC